MELPLVEQTHYIGLLRPKMIICDESIIGTITKTLNIIQHSAIVYLFTNVDHAEHKAMADLISGYESEKSNFV